MFPKVEFMLDMYDDIDWMDEPTETGWMPAPEQVKIYQIALLCFSDLYIHTTNKYPNAGWHKVREPGNQVPR